MRKVLHSPSLCRTLIIHRQALLPAEIPLVYKLLFPQTSGATVWWLTKVDLLWIWLERGTSLEGLSSKKLVGFNETDMTSIGMTGKSHQS